MPAPTAGVGGLLGPAYSAAEKVWSVTEPVREKFAETNDASLLVDQYDRLMGNIANFVANIDEVQRWIVGTSEALGKVNQAIEYYQSSPLSSGDVGDVGEPPLGRGAARPATEPVPEPPIPEALPTEAQVLAGIPDDEESYDERIERWKARLKEFRDQQKLHTSELTKLLGDEKRVLLDKVKLYEKVAQTGGQVMGGLTSTILGGLDDLVKGQEVAFDKLIADFLVQQGTQLVASGIAAMTQGGLRLAFSYGADATGYQLLGEGGFAAGLGAVMLAGGLPMTAAAYHGGGGGGAPGVSGLGAGRGVGGALSQGPSGSAAASEPITINYFGKPSPEFGRFVADSIEERRRQRG